MFNLRKLFKKNPDILFIEKTGTITKGYLEVVELCDGNGTSLPLEVAKDNELLALAIAQTSGMGIDTLHNITRGTTTDKALFSLIGEQNFRNIRENDALWDSTEVWAYSDEHMFGQAFVGKDYNLTLYNGMPSAILGKATKYLDANGNEVPLDTDKAFEKVRELVKRGMRVLVFGYSRKDATAYKVNDDVVILGFVGIRDDIKPGVKEKIKEMQDAGIHVIMVSYDNKALAIAKEAGITRGDEIGGITTLTPGDLDQMKDEDIEDIAPRIEIIKNALPYHIVRLKAIYNKMELTCDMLKDGEL